MYLRLKPLIGYRAAGQDGDIGQIKDIYLDDDAWRVRYLVIETSKDLDKRLVLVAPLALLDANAGEKAISLQLTREQVRHSPDIDTAKPVARQHEASLYDYYGWPYYWTIGPVPGQFASPGIVILPEAQDDNRQGPASSTAGSSGGGDPHLRSLREISGYRLHARDGSIGHLDDLISETQDWNILYLMVKTGSWLAYHDVLLSPQWVTEIRWADKEIAVDLKQETIQNSPAYDPSQPLDATYEALLKEHYQKHR